MTSFFRPRLRLSLICALLVAVTPLLAACGDDGQEAYDGKIKVVTTLSLFADFVRRIGGDRVEANALLPAGSDPHTWEPSPSDVQRIVDADVAFANGLDLEPAAIRLINSNLKGGARVVTLGERAREVDVEMIDDNPHLWLDIGNAQVYAATVMSELKSLDPDHASLYQQNLSRFVDELSQTDEYIRAPIAAIPAPDRRLVTTHDAFPYLARYLGLEIVAFAEAGPGQEASPDDIAQLTRALRGQSVPAVFTEPQIESGNKLLEQAAQDAGVQVCTLYSDSLDERVTSYIELMRFNADELARCLGSQN